MTTIRLRQPVSGERVGEPLQVRIVDVLARVSGEASIEASGRSTAACSDEVVLGTQY
ncbi:MAG: hypothetical protein LC797_09465 [Chloroflexi bacterium]|nr:hypothetical protein [Chloroflexota bacterium]